MSSNFNAVPQVTAYIDRDLFQLRNPDQLVKFLGARCIYMHPTDATIVPKYVPQWSTSVIDALVLAEEYEMRMDVGPEVVRGSALCGTKTVTMEVVVLEGNSFLAWSEAVARLALAVEQIRWIMFGSTKVTV